MPNEAGYHPVAKLLHWSTVLLVVAQFGFAFAMADDGRQRLPDRAAVLHIGTGVLILGITLARLACRARFRSAVPISGAGNWERRGARAAHLLLYGLLVALPLSGMAAAHLRGWEVSFFGIPVLAAATPEVRAPTVHLVATVHAWAAVALLVLLGLHVLAAGYHFYIRADGVVERMMPGSFKRRPRRGARAVPPVTRS